jgi:hypothetical protein
MAQEQTLEERVAKLESRNQRVEADKGWEISWTRRIAIMALTYATVVFYLQFVVHIDPWVNALVPVIAYFISTLTIRFFKQQWIARKQR